MAVFIWIFFLFLHVFFRFYSASILFPYICNVLCASMRNGTQNYVLFATIHLEHVQIERNLNVSAIESEQKNLLPHIFRQDAHTIYTFSSYAHWNTHSPNKLNEKNRKNFRFYFISTIVYAVWCWCVMEFLQRCYCLSLFIFGIVW